jgi:hypothetical protein
LIEWELVLMQMLPAAVVLRLAIKRTVLAVSGVLMLAIKRMVVLRLVKLPLYQKQILRSRQEWFAFLGTHVNAPMIS